MPGVALVVCFEGIQAVDMIHHMEISSSVKPEVRVLPVSSAAVFARFAHTAQRRPRASVVVHSHSNIEMIAHNEESPVGVVRRRRVIARLWCCLRSSPRAVGILCDVQEALP